MVNAQSLLRRLGTGLLLLMLATAAAASGSCDRASFGRWTQTDLKDTRARVLEASAVGPVVFRTGSNGKRIVASGSWQDAYSGRLYSGVRASRMEIDHVIPVCWAWRHGAAAWDRQRKRQFYNDVRFLKVVEQGLNDQKSDKGPDEFLPLGRDGACRYVILFQKGIREYDLALHPAENAAIESSRRQACG